MVGLGGLVVRVFLLVVGCEYFCELLGEMVNGCGPVALGCGGDGW